MFVVTPVAPLVRTPKPLQANLAPPHVAAPSLGGLDSPHDGSVAAILHCEKPRALELTWTSS